MTDYSESIREAIMAYYHDRGLTDWDEGPASKMVRWFDALETKAKRNEARVKELEAGSDYSVIEWRDMCKKAEARAERYKAALERIASPNSDRDLPLVLREIARNALKED